MTPLSVFWDAALVGRLDPAGRQGLVFTYDAGYLDHADARPISVALPLQAASFSTELSTSWFANLLPEGEVRGHVARRLGVSERNDFGLLAGVGGDCAGALSLQVDGELPPAAGDSHGEPMSWQQLEDTVNRTPRPSLLALMLSESELRLSLAGAQDKLPVRLDGDALSLPTGGTPSTHLLKVAGAAFPELVRNELFCLALARAVGLPVPAARLAPTKTPMLLVERYDREYSDNRVVRLHQEDLCQALGVDAESKYEAEGGPGLADVFMLVTRVSRSPLVDRGALVKWVLFNHVIGNADAHGKNLSLLHGARRDIGAPVLAPFYDLVCTAVYPELSRRQAMKVGGEARRDRIESRHWRRFAESVGIGPGFLANAGLDLCDLVEASLSMVARQIGAGDVVGRVVEHVTRQVGRVRSDLERVR